MNEAVAERTKCEHCLKRSRERQQRWKERHKEQALEVSRRYRANNPEKVRAAVRKWQRENPEGAYRYRTENPEKVRENYVKWCAEHPENLRIIQHRRRARKLGAAGTCSAEQLRARANLHGGRCYICALQNKLTPYEAIDHVIPLAKGGSNWPSNLRPICNRHNQQKGMKSLREFLEVLS